MVQGRRCCAGILTLQQVPSGLKKYKFSAKMATLACGYISVATPLPPRVLPRAGTLVQPRSERMYFLYFKWLTIVRFQQEELI